MHLLITGRARAYVCEITEQEEAKSGEKMGRCTEMECLASNSTPDQLQPGFLSYLFSGPEMGHPMIVDEPLRSGFLWHLIRASGRHQLTPLCPSGRKHSNGTMVGSP